MPEFEYEDENEENINLSEAVNLDNNMSECLLPSVNALQHGLSSPLASEESTKRSLESIRNGVDGLNKHRQALLLRVPNQNDWASFKLNEISNKDLAYLSAETGDEFALMRGKNEDILFHGTVGNCAIEKNELLMSLLELHKLRLECHSHPDYDRIIPSMDDRRFLKHIGQQESKIISSYTGKEITFTSDRFENI